MEEIKGYDNWKLMESPSQTNPFENKIGEDVEFYYSVKGLSKLIIGIVVDTDIDSVTLNFCGNKTTYLLENITND